MIEDCRVFRTKARAPSLIVCEVVRNDLHELPVWMIENDDEDSERRSRKHAKNKGDKQQGSNSTDSSSSSVGSVPASPPSSPSQLPQPPKVLFRNPEGSSGASRARVRTCSSNDISIPSSPSPSPPFPPPSDPFSPSSPLPRSESVGLGLSEVDGLVNLRISQAIREINTNQEAQTHSIGDTDASSSSSSSSSSPSMGQHLPALSPLPLPHVARRPSGALVSSNRKTTSSNFQTILTSASTGEVGLVLTPAFSSAFGDGLGEKTEKDLELVLNSLDREVSLAPPAVTVSDSSNNNFASDALVVSGVAQVNSDGASTEASQLSASALDPSISSSSSSSSSISVASDRENNEKELTERELIRDKALVTQRVIASAQRLLQAGKIDEKEYEQLIMR